MENSESFEKEKITCPKCKKENYFAVWHNVNVGENPELKEQVLSGSLFQYKCPDCGAVTTVDYGMLYHDPDKKIMIQRVQSAEEMQVVEGVFSSFLAEENAEQAGRYAGYTLRVVDSVNRLREKVYLKELSYDDRAIELMKIYVYKHLTEENEGIRIEEILLEIKEGKPTDFAIRLEGGQWGSAYFSEEFYKEVEKEFFGDAQKTASKDCIVDFVWAAEFLKKNR